jgi:hypothetical protein
MLQRRPNSLEFRSMDYYIQILCRFQKCSKKFLHSCFSVMKNHPLPPKERFFSSLSFYGMSQNRCHFVLQGWTLSGNSKFLKINFSRLIYQFFYLNFSKNLTPYPCRLLFEISSLKNQVRGTACPRIYKEGWTERAFILCKT